MPTVNPASCRARQQAAPMPLPPPVTMATGLSLLCLLSDLVIWHQSLYGFIFLLQSSIFCLLSSVFCLLAFSRLFKRIAFVNDILEGAAPGLFNPGHGFVVRGYGRI